MRALLLGLSLLVFGGCGDDDFTPRYLLDEYRVLAIVADPPAVRPEGIAALRVVDFAPADLEPGPDPVRTYVWSTCLYTLGSVTRFECLPGLEVVQATDDGQVIIDFGPGGDFADLPVPDALAGAGMIPPGVDTFGELVAAVAAVPVPEDWEVDPDRLREGADPDALVFGDLAPDDGYRSILNLVLAFVENTGELPDFGFDPDDVQVYTRLLASIPGAPPFEAVKRVRVTEDALNVAPRIESLSGVEEGARLPAGGEVRLEAAVSDPDIETGSDLLLSWYVSGGELDRALASGELLDNTWELPEEPGPARLFLVVRDRDGGVDVVSRRVEIVEGT